MCKCVHAHLCLRAAKCKTDAVSLQRRYLAGHKAGRLVAIHQSAGTSWSGEICVWRSDRIGRACISCRHNSTLTLPHCNQALYRYCGLSHTQHESCACFHLHTHVHAHTNTRSHLDILALPLSCTQHTHTHTKDAQALIDACQRGDIDVVRQLLASPNIYPSNKKKHLCIALCGCCRGNCTKRVRLRFAIRCHT